MASILGNAFIAAGDGLRTNQSKAGSSATNDTTTGLKLMLATGKDFTKPAGVKGLFGTMRMADQWQTPSLTRTSRVDILSSEDKSLIVLMLRDNGPIYSSTNSGMSWTLITAPGTYEFPLTTTPEYGGFYAKGTIHPSTDNQTQPPAPASNWYVVGSGAGGSRMVITSDPTQPAPALSLASSARGLVVSWPASFADFVLQSNKDLSTTNWTDVTNAVVVGDEARQVLITSPDGNNFFRLRRRQ